MRALYASKIYKPRRTANESPSRRSQFSGTDSPTPRRNDARAVGYPFAPRKGPAYHRMGLETLKLVEWGKRRIFVVEMHHKSYRNQPGAIMIKK